MSGTCSGFPIFENTREGFEWVSVYSIVLGAVQVLSNNSRFIAVSFPPEEEVGPDVSGAEGFINVSGFAVGSRESPACRFLGTDGCCSAGLRAETKSAGI